MEIDSELVLLRVIAWGRPNAVITFPARDKVILKSNLKKQFEKLLCD